MKTTKHTTVAVIVTFLAVWASVLCFWLGALWGINKSRRQLSGYEAEISILKTNLSSQEWYIADEKRKNAAFQEVIEMDEAMKYHQEEMEGE